jgi:hypothetical protein
MPAGVNSPEKIRAAVVGKSMDLQIAVAGLDPAIHVLETVRRASKEGVDARVKPGQNVFRLSQLRTIAFSRTALCFRRDSNITKKRRQYDIY